MHSALEVQILNHWTVREIPLRGKPLSLLFLITFSKNSFRFTEKLRTGSSHILLHTQFPLLPASYVAMVHLAQLMNQC